MTLERSQRALARARAKAHKTIDDFPLVTITGVEERVELRRVTGLLGAETVFVDVTGVTEALSDDDLIRIWPQPDKAGIYKFHSFVRRSGTNTAGDVFVPALRTNTVRGPHGFTVEVFDTIGDPGGGHQSKFEWSNADGVWRIHPAQDGSPAGLDLVDGNITLPSGGTVDGVDVSVLGSNAILKTLVDTKGDLIVASADNTVTRLAVGSDGAFLIPDSGEPTGLKWTATLKETTTALVVNDGQAADKDFIVKGKTDAQLIVADYDEDAIAIGGAVESGVKFKVHDLTKVDVSKTDNFDIGLQTLLTISVTGDATGYPRGSRNECTVSVDNGTTLGGQVRGFEGITTASGAGTANIAIGSYSRIRNTGSGTVGDARGVMIANPQNNGGGQITTNNAIYIENQTAGVTNRAILSQGGQCLLLAGGATVTPLALRGAASQTADLAQLQTSAAAVRRSWDANGLDKLMADQTTDTAPNDDTTLKKLTLQKLAAAPSNAAYIAFQQCPGTDVFYLVLEEG